MFVSPRFSAQQRVKVTILSQVSTGSQEADQKVFDGMLKQPSIAAIKKSLLEFFESWKHYLSSQSSHKYELNSEQPLSSKNLLSSNGDLNRKKTTLMSSQRH